MTFLPSVYSYSSDNSAQPCTCSLHSLQGSAPRQCATTTTSADCRRSAGTDGTSSTSPHLVGTVSYRLYTAV